MMPAVAPILLLLQLQQLERERQAEREASEAILAGLKDQVTAVLNRYLSKDLELDKALQEMQALGIELVPLDPQDSRCERGRVLGSCLHHACVRASGVQQPCVFDSSLMTLCLLVVSSSSSDSVQL
jgi:hypothetical protein